jgi:hypothetical protein
MKRSKIEKPSVWTSRRKFALTWTAFTAVAVIIGAFWHSKLFEEQYKSFNFITASEVIIPLALSSMLLLGFISTYFFSHIYKANSGTFGAIKTAIMVVLIPRMVVTFAHAAEQDVNGKVMSLILFEIALYTIMAIIWGLIAGKIYKH